jgi:Retrotransposon gag protein
MSTVEQSASAVAPDVVTPTVPNEQEQLIRNYIDRTVAETVHAQVVRAAAASQQPAAAQRWAIDPKHVPKPSKFNGKTDNSRDFLDSLDQYMRLLNYPFDSHDGNVVLLASSFLDGAARRWWRMHQDDLETYDAFRNKFLERFAPIDEKKEARHQLENLRQRGPVKNYADAFNAVALALGNTATEEDLIFKFIAGLKPEVRVMVDTAAPKTLDSAMQIATNIDRSIYIWRRFSNGLTNKFRGSRSYYHSSSSAGPSTYTEAVPMELGAMMPSVRPAGNKYGQQRGALVCWRCHKPGHKMAECKAPKQQTKPQRSGN